MKASSLSGQSILVTGATGFIGRRLVSRLLAGGAHVHLMQRNDHQISERCEVLIADFGADDAAAQIDTALAGRRFDVIFNLAASGVVRQTTSSVEFSRKMAQRVNVESALVLIAHATASRSGVFLQAGSCSEYAPPSTDAARVETDASEHRQNNNDVIYGASKARATDALLAAVRGTAMPLAVARIFNVYGPGEKIPRLLPSVIDGLAKGQRIPLSSGHQIKDYLHIDDVTEGLCELAVAARKQNFQEVVNLSSGRGVSVAQFARAVARSMGRSEELLGFGERPTYKDEAAVLVGSTARREELTNWRPKFSLKIGLQDAVRQMISLSSD
jgi:nucleoside-diphosphate-sugar epimerase